MSRWCDRSIHDAGHSDRPNGLLRGRTVVWNPCRGNHLGQRSCASASTGRTYGRNDLIKTLQNTLRVGAVHIWHLDEMVVKINGRRMWLWRAVDDEGEVLDMLVQKRRNAHAATKRRH